MRLSLAVLFSVLCFGCGGSGSPTSPGSSIAGTWTGTIVEGSRSEPITLTLSQSGASVTGNWVKFEGPNDHDGEGTVTGQVSGSSFSGTMTNVTVCQPASATVSGTISGNRMTWNSGGFVNSRACAVEPLTITVSK